MRTALLLCAAVARAEKVRTSPCQPKKGAGLFIILCRQRSGSHWLVRLLNAASSCIYCEIVRLLSVDGSRRCRGSDADRPRLPT